MNSFDCYYLSQRGDAYYTHVLHALKSACVLYMSAYYTQDSWYVNFDKYAFMRFDIWSVMAWLD